MVIGGFGLSGYLVFELDRVETSLSAEIDSLESVIEAKDAEIADRDEEIASRDALITSKESEIDDLNLEIQGLETVRSSVEAELSSTESELEGVRVEKSQVEAQLDLTESQLEMLQTQYDSLQGDYEVKMGLEAGNSLTSFYDCVRRDYGLAGDKSRWAGEADKMRFGAKLALHDLGYNTWGTLEFSYFQDVGNHSYVDAWERLQRVLLFCDVEGSETPSEMIEKILGFIYENVDYQLVMEDVIRAAVETLGLGSGDCDDF
ncbi:MAG: hypothetical protein JSV18_07745, partial [Candidatus Bathyarchaeota archaeon]